ncbi:MAG: phosphodiester glycosidase family protein [Balneolaceae bacterium]
MKSRVQHKQRTPFLNAYLFWLRIATVLFVFIPIHQSAAQDTVSDSIFTADRLEWQTEIVAEGVYWKKYLGDDLYNARLSINVIEIDLTLSGIDLKLASIREDLTHTSDLAIQFDAIAAINGSFFDMNTGNSVVYIRADGETVSRGAAGRNVYTENGGIGWDSGLDPVIIARPDQGWATMEFENLLASGPLLIQNGDIKEFSEDPFHVNRHPRTAVGLTHDNKLLLVAVDGRSFQSFGMTIPELARFFSELNATHALNLDGGGSTVMWIDGMSENGIVNYPSDNFEFDHHGERAVSNALLLIQTSNN